VTRGRLRVTRDRLGVTGLPIVMLSLSKHGPADARRSRRHDGDQRHGDDRADHAGARDREYERCARERDCDALERCDCDALERCDRDPFERCARVREKIRGHDGERYAQVARELIGSFERSRDARDRVVVIPESGWCAAELLRQREHAHEHEAPRKRIAHGRFRRILARRHDDDCEQREIVERLEGLANRGSAKCRVHDRERRSHGNCRPGQQECARRRITKRGQRARSAWRSERSRRAERAARNETGEGGEEGDLRERDRGRPHVGVEIEGDHGHECGDSESGSPPCEERDGDETERVDRDVDDVERRSLHVLRASPPSGRIPGAT
jgi:hypothetical protein